MIKKGTYHRMNVAHLLPVFGSKLVTEITPMDVRNYQDAQLRKNYAPASVNHDVATLRGILEEIMLGSKSVWTYTSCRFPTISASR